MVAGYEKKPATCVQILEIAEQLNDSGKWFIETLCEYMNGGSEMLTAEIVEQRFIPLSVIEDIETEIKQVVCEETNDDEKWSRGLHYALKIIDKHMAEIQ